MVTVGYSMVRAGYRVLTVDYCRLQQVTEQVISGYRVVTVGYNRLQQVTECLQWVTAGYSRVPSGYSG